MTLNRRDFLGAAAATSVLAGLGLTRATAAEPLNIALITPSPIADVGWSRSLATGLEEVNKELGGALKLTFIDKINEGPDADRIMEKAVADGNKIVIAGSFGYMNGAMQLARRHPDVAVLHASGFKTLPNFSNFTARNYEGTYLMGMAAASVTKSKKLGVVGAFPIPELLASNSAFALGAQAIDPTIEVSVVWVNSWFDPAKEQDSAKALIAQGCDVVFSNAQDTPSVVALCEKEGVYTFNLNSTMKKYAPTKYLGVVLTDWAPYFKREIDAKIAGTFEGTANWLGIKDGVIKCVDWSADLSAEIVEKIKAAEAAIADGSHPPFAGPVIKDDGTELAAAGTNMTDEQLWPMDWQVKGIVTPLPK
ncbi:BMP family ABC transporter substrate-binding protein [Paracoccus aminophilus]|uniref:Basic membrane lipoprotein n=1 Tax=Paracoccus aminophilus JCM 7686 TaxID=1367847 RepID=S5YYK4_PARAH|nr:BMP family ABC transporter substrate-binding protein [Paracoccus aminophilus]AGT10286.1 basic membrane lipoprotein [Paracoccus aminophilus JCM 7686]